MIQKSIFTLMIACFAFLTTNAQNLQSSIPKDASFILTINPAVTNSKVKFSKLKEFDFIQEGIKEMIKGAGEKGPDLQKFIDDPATYGFDLLSSTYLFGKMDGKDVFMGMTMKVGDKAKFNKTINDYIAPLAPVQEVKGMKFVAPDDEAKFAWNDKQLFFGAVDMAYNTEEEYDAFKERKKKTATEWVNSIIGTKAGNSMATHPKFQMANVTKDDVNFFADYEALSKLSADLQGNGADPMTAMMMGMMSELYKDSYAAFRLNFNKGATEISTDYYMNETMMNIYKKITDASFNNKFLQYVPKKNLGYMSFNMNVNNIIDLIKTSENPMLAQYPVYESMALEGLKEMGVEITAEELYNVWKGDIMFVVTGVKEFEREVATYEFDDDFNKKEVKKMKKETLPEFIMMMSHGSKANVLKFIDLAKQSSMVTEEKGFFSLAVPDLPMDVFFRVDNDMIIVSNSKDMATKKASQLFKKSELISPKEAALINNSFQRIYWDIPATMDEIAKMEDVNMNEQEGKLFNMGKDSFKNMIIQADKKVGDSMNSVMQLNFNNKNVNSLEQIFGLINKIYYEMEGGSKM